MANTNKLKLGAEFSPISTEQWMDKITADLKGASFEKKLVWKTGEGFDVQPFYREEDLNKISYLNAMPGQFPFVRGDKKSNNEWFVRQTILVENVEDANKKALDILQKGIDSLCFAFCNKDFFNDKLMETLLKGIDLSCIEINFNGPCMPKILNFFISYVKAKGYDPATIVGSVDFDPLGRMLYAGNFGKSFEDAMKLAIDMVKKVGAELPRSKFRIIGVNAIHFNNAGALSKQELAYALSMGVEYLSRLVDAGIPAALAAKKIKFNFGIDANYFMEIAKFRAARLLWAKIVESYKPDCPAKGHCTNVMEGNICACACAMNIHATTSQWNMTSYDPNVNMLRSQTEAMSATLGGVNSLTVMPYDITFNKPSDFSERIARNQQLLLKEESHFDKIVDPAGGSYYIESLTQSLADASWNLFLATEKEGGFYKAIKASTVQAAIEEVSSKRRLAVAQRREILLGTNQYPNFNENIAENIQVGITDKYCTCAPVEVIQALNFTRGAEEFEALRLAVEKSGKRPVVYMLKLGNIAMRQARAQFASNFFGCAGYKVIEDLGHDSVSEGVKAAKLAQANIVVICSSDDEYATLALEAKKQLGDLIFVVAGAPACADELKAEGIENFISVRSNVLNELKAYNEKML